MKLTAINKECQIEDSKLFGESYLPNEWLENDTFSPFEFFLCQLNLQELNVDGLPSNGYIYFFVDAFDLKESKMKAKVRYFSGEPDAYTDFNDGYFDFEPECYQITSEQNSPFLKNLEILNDFNKDISKVELLKIPTDLLPFDLKSKFMLFIIDRSSLKNLEFENSSLVFLN